MYFNFSVLLCDRHMIFRFFKQNRMKFKNIHKLKLNFGGSGLEQTGHQ